MTLICEYQFSSAHFYKQKHWSIEKNGAVFGKCFTDYGHGHNYRLELEIDIGNEIPSTARDLISGAVHVVLNRLDHQHLNFTIPEFKEVVPTTENISLYLRAQIQIPPPYRLGLVRLFEMDTIFVELTV